LSLDAFHLILPDRDKDSMDGGNLQKCVQRQHQDGLSMQLKKLLGSVFGRAADCHARAQTCRGKYDENLHER
jgi:hypothetical protein